MKKFKHFLIGLLCLIPSMFMLACGEIKASNIYFEETEISLILGTQLPLEPVVEPSDTQEKITYKSSDKNVAYIVDNSTLVASSVGNAIITATTDSGLSVAIKVTVVKDSIQLATPTNISYNKTSNKLVWSSVLHTNTYELQITPKGGVTQTITVYNNEYTFEGLEHNTEYSVKVKAIPTTHDNTVYLASESSVEYKFLKLAAPENFVYDLNTNKITFAEVDYDEHDIEYILAVNGNEIPLTSTEYIFTPPATGEYIFTVYAKAIQSDLNIFSSEVKSLTITKLATPTLTNDGTYIQASSDDKAVVRMFINNQLQTGLKVAHTYFETAGEYVITANAVRTSTGSNYFIQSDTASYTVTKLAAPQNVKLTSEANKKVKLSWDLVEGAVSYTIFKNGTELKTQPENSLVFDEEVGSNSYYVRANIAASTTSLNKNSDFSETKTVVKEDIVEVAYNKVYGRVYFVLPTSLTAGSSILFVGNVGAEQKFTQTLQSTTTKTYVEIGNDFDLSENEYVFTAQVIGKQDANVLYLNSEITSLNIGVLAKPEVTLSDKTATTIKASWEKVTNAESYVVKVNGQVLETEQSDIGGVMSVEIENVQSGITEVTVQSLTTNNRYLDSLETTTSFTKLNAVELEFNNDIKTTNSIGIKWNKLELATEEETATISYEVYVNGQKRNSAQIQKVGKVYFFTVAGLTSANTTYTINVLAKSTSEIILEQESNTLTVTKATTISGISHVIEENEGVKTSIIEFEDLTETSYILNFSRAGVNRTFEESQIVGGKVRFTLGETDEIFNEVGYYYVSVQTIQNGKLDTQSASYTIERAADVSASSIVRSANGETISWNAVPRATHYETFVNGNRVVVSTNSLDFSQYTEIGEYTFEVKALNTENNLILESFNLAEEKFYNTDKLATPTITYDKTNNKITVSVADRRAENLTLSLNGVETEHVLSEEVFEESVFSYRYVTIDLERFVDAGEYKFNATVKINSSSEFLIESETEIVELELYGTILDKTYYTLVSSSQAQELTLNKLEIPTGLKYNLDLGRLEWDSVAGADGYIVKVTLPGEVKTLESEYNYLPVNSIQELEVGGNYSFTVISISNENEVLTSEESAAQVFAMKSQLATPSINGFAYNADLSKYVLTLDESPNATSYKIYVGNSYVISTTNRYEFNSADFPAGETTISAQALITSNEIGNSVISDSIVITKKPTVNTLNLSGTIYTPGSTHEAQKIIGTQVESITEALDLSTLSSVRISVRDVGSEVLEDGAFEMSSEWKTYSISRILAPQITFDAENNVVWESVTDATGYDVYVNGELYTPSTELTENKFVPAFANPGSYTIRVRAIIPSGDGQDGTYKISSSLSNQLNITILEEISNLSISLSNENNVIVTFNPVASAQKYQLFSDGELFSTKSVDVENSNIFNMGQIEIGKRYRVYVIASKSSTADIIGHSVTSETVELYKIKTPELSYSSEGSKNFVTIENYEEDYAGTDFALFVQYDQEAKIPVTKRFELQEEWSDFSKIKVTAEYTEDSTVYINSDAATVSVQRLAAPTGFNFVEEVNGTSLNWNAVANAKEYIVNLVYLVEDSEIEKKLSVVSTSSYMLPTTLPVGDMTFRVIAVANDKIYFNSVEGEVSATKLALPELTKKSNIDGNFINVTTTYAEGVEVFIKVGNAEESVLGVDEEILDSYDLSKVKVYAKYTEEQDDAVYILKSNDVVLSDRYSRLAQVSGIAVADNIEQIILSWSSVANANSYSIDILKKQEDESFAELASLTSNSNNIDITSSIDVGTLKIVIRAYTSEEDTLYFNSQIKEVLARKLETPTLTYEHKRDFAADNTPISVNNVVNTQDYPSNVTIYAKYGSEELTFTDNVLTVPDTWIDLTQVIIYAAHNTGASTDYIEISSLRKVGLDITRLATPIGITLSINEDRNLVVNWDAVTETEKYSHYSIVIKNERGEVVYKQDGIDKAGDEFIVDRTRISVTPNVNMSFSLELTAYSLQTADKFNSLAALAEFERLAKPTITYKTVNDNVYKNYINITNYNAYIDDDSNTKIYAVYEEEGQEPIKITCGQLQEIPDEWVEISKIRLYAHLTDYNKIVLDSDDVSLMATRQEQPQNIQATVEEGYTTIEWDMVIGASSYVVRIYSGEISEDNLKEQKVVTTNKCDLCESVEQGNVSVEIRTIGNPTAFKLNSFRTTIGHQKLEKPILEYTSDDEANYIRFTNYEYYVSTYGTRMVGEEEKNNAVAYVKYGADSPIVLDDTIFTIPEEWTNLDNVRVYVNYEGDQEETIYIPSYNLILSSEIKRLDIPKNYTINEAGQTVRLTWTNNPKAKKYIVTFYQRTGENNETIVPLQVIDNITTNYVNVPQEVIGNCYFIVKAIANSGDDFNSLTSEVMLKKLEAPTIECSSDDNGNYIKLNKIYDNGITVYFTYGNEEYPIYYDTEFEILDAWTDISKIKIYAKCTNQKQTVRMISSDRISVTINRLSAPSNVNIEKDLSETEHIEDIYSYLTWDAVDGSIGYIITVKETRTGGSTNVFERQEETIFDLRDMNVPNGEIEIYIRAISESGVAFNSLKTKQTKIKLTRPQIVAARDSQRNYISINKAICDTYETGYEGIYIQYDEETPIRISTAEYSNPAGDIEFSIPDEWVEFEKIKVYAQIFEGTNVKITSSIRDLTVLRIADPQNLRFVYSNSSRITELVWEAGDTDHSDFLLTIYQNGEIVKQKTTNKEARYILEEDIPTGDLVFSVRALTEKGNKFNSLEVKLDAYKLETPELEYSSDEDNNYATVTNKEYYNEQGATLNMAYSSSSAPFTEEKRIIGDNYMTLNYVEFFATYPNAEGVTYKIRSNGKFLDDITRLPLVPASIIEIDKSIPGQTYFRWPSIFEVIDPVTDEPFYKADELKAYRVDMYNEQGTCVYTKTDVPTNELLVDDTVPSGHLTIKVRALSNTSKYFNSLQPVLTGVLRLEMPDLKYVADEFGNYIQLNNEDSYPSDVAIFIKIGEEEPQMFLVDGEPIKFQIADEVELEDIIVYSYVTEETEENRKTIYSVNAKIEIDRLPTIQEETIFFSDENNLTYLNWEEIEGASKYKINVYNEEGELAHTFYSDINKWAVEESIAPGKITFEIRAIGVDDVCYNSRIVTRDATKLSNDVVLTVINGQLSWNKTDQEGAIKYRIAVNVEEDGSTTEIFDVDLTTFKQLLPGVTGNLTAGIKIVGDVDNNYISSDMTSDDFFKLYPVKYFYVNKGEFAFETDELNTNKNPEYYVLIDGKEYLADDSALLQLYKDMKEDETYTAKMFVRANGCLTSDFTEELTVKKLIHAYEADYWLYTNKDQTETFLHWESPDKIDTIKILMENKNQSGSGTLTNKTYETEAGVLKLDISDVLTSYSYKAYAKFYNDELSYIGEARQSITLRVPEVEGVERYAIFYVNKSGEISREFKLVENLESEAGYKIITIENTTVYSNFLGIACDVEEYEEVTEWLDDYSWSKTITWSAYTGDVELAGYVIKEQLNYSGVIAIYEAAQYSAEKSKYYVNYRIPEDIRHGEWTIYMQRFGGSQAEEGVHFINSDISKQLPFVKLETPPMSIRNGQLYWDKVSFATKYLVLYKEEIIYSGTDNRFEPGVQWSDMLKDKEWTFKVIAIGNVYETGHEEQVNPIYVSSSFDDLKVLKARVLGNILVENGTFIWDESLEYTYNQDRNKAKIEIQFWSAGELVTTLEIDIGLIYPNNADSEQDAIEREEEELNKDEDEPFVPRDPIPARYLDFYRQARLYLQENKEYTIKYRELGGTTCINSEYVEITDRTFKIANSPKNPIISNGYLRWDKVTLDDHGNNQTMVYDIYRTSTDSYDQYVYVTTLSGVDGNEISLQTLREGLPASTKNIVIVTRGDNDNYLSGHFTNPIQVKVLNDKTSLTIKDGFITWQEVKDAKGYEIRVLDDDRQEVKVESFAIGTDDTTYNWYMEGTSPSYPAGTYYLQIRAIAGDVDATDYIPINAEYSDLLEFIKLETPVVRIQDGAIVWNPVQNASGYRIYYELPEIGENGEEFGTIDLGLDECIYEPELEFISGAIYIQALGSTGPVGGKHYVASNRASINTERVLDELRNITIVDNIVSWETSAADALTYIVKVYGISETGVEVSLKDETTDKQFNLLDFNLEGGDYTVDVRVKGLAGKVNSIPYGFVEFVVLSKVKSPSMTQGFLVWEKEDNLVSTYSIHIYVPGNDQFDYTYIVDTRTNSVVKLNGEPYSGDSIFTTGENASGYEQYKFWPKEVEAFSDPANYIQAQYTVEITALGRDSVKYSTGDTKSVDLSEFKQKDFTFYTRRAVGSTSFELVELSPELIVLAFCDRDGKQIGDAILWSTLEDVVVENSIDSIINPPPAPEEPEDPIEPEDPEQGTGEEGDGEGSEGNLENPEEPTPPEEPVINTIPEGTATVKFMFRNLTSFYTEQQIKYLQDAGLYPITPYYTWNWKEEADDTIVVSSKKVAVNGVVLKYPDIGTSMSFDYDANKITWKPSTTGTVYYSVEEKIILQRQTYELNPSEYSFVAYVDSLTATEPSENPDEAAFVLVTKYQTTSVPEYAVGKNVGELKSIRIQCLPDSGANLTNRFMSNFSNEYVIQKPEAPTEVKFANGTLSWKASPTPNTSYIVKYKFNNKLYTQPVGTQTAYTFTEIGQYTNLEVIAVITKAHTQKAEIETTGTNIDKFDEQTGYYFRFNLYNSGAGTELNPYIIMNETQLRAIDFYPNAYFKLGANIGSAESPIEITYAKNASENVNTMIGVNSLFRGVLNGNGFTITVKMRVNASLSSADDFGLFQKAQNANFIGVNVVVSSLSVTLSSSNNFYIGLLVGKMYNTTITDCTFKTTQGQTIFTVRTLTILPESVVVQDSNPSYGRILQNPMSS